MLSFYYTRATYPWPFLLTYAGNFVSSRGQQLALADPNGYIWTQEIQSDGNLLISSKSVLGGSNPALETDQLSVTTLTVTGDAPLTPSSPGTQGQIVASGNSIYWFANGQWYQASGTPL